MMIPKTIILITACIIGSFILMATTNTEVTEVEIIPETTTSLTGTVVDSSTREGIPMAQVTLLEAGESTTTDEYGSFYFTDLEAGTYSITAEAVNYRPAEERLEITEEGATIEIQLDPEYK